MALTEAQRKRNQRKREAAHLVAMGKTVLSIDMYSGTTEALARITEASVIEQPAEVLTAMIHLLDRLRISDLSLFKRLTSVENLSKSA
jgi:hypothetical protein